MTGIEETRYTVIDIGSNGVRFSLGNRLVRHLPVVYEERLVISLYEAQSDSGDSSLLKKEETENIIPESVVISLVEAFKRIKRLSDDFGVEFIEAVATETLRTASNTKVILERLWEETGIRVRLLSKVEEAHFSSLGIVASLPRVDGLAMDLGGGSLEFIKVNFPVETLSLDNETSHSFPLGAALVKSRLSKEEMGIVRSEVVGTFGDYLKQSKLEKGDIKTLYWSGGGFRSLGYILLHHFNIPLRIINGFQATRDEVMEVIQKYFQLSPEAIHKEDIFRVSKRRSHMIKASCFLAQEILTFFDKVDRICFAEGGVRQGVLFNRLSLQERLEDPLKSGIRDYVHNRPHLPCKQIDRLTELLLPILSNQQMDQPTVLSPRILYAASSLCQVFSHFPKESKAICALNLPLSGGDLASLPGLFHNERVTISLILTYRYGAKVPDELLSPVRKLLPKGDRKVCKLLGQLMDLLVSLVPIDHLLIHPRPTSLLDQIQLTVPPSTDRPLQLHLPKADYPTLFPLLTPTLTDINKKHQVLELLSY